MAQPLPVEEYPTSLQVAAVYAHALRSAGEVDSAIVVLQDAVSREGADSEAARRTMPAIFNNLGYYLRLKGDLEGAAGNYRRSLEEYGTSMRYSERQQVMVNLASTLRLMGDTVGATPTRSVDARTRRLDIAGVAR